MTANLSPKAMLGDVLWCALGRRNLVRLARFLSNHSRLDTENTSDVNGEFAVLRRFLASRDICSFCGIDVGANVGLWTISAIETARKFHQEARIHAFEPCGETFATLQASLGQAGVTAHVTLNNMHFRPLVGRIPFTLLVQTSAETASMALAARKTQPSILCEPPRWINTAKRMGWTTSTSSRSTPRGMKWTCFSAGRR